MKLYTKTGDDGSTGLFGGSRVSKCDMRVAAYGEVDELNAVLGWCAQGAEDDLQARLHKMQSTLFDIGAELATPNSNPQPQHIVPLSSEAVAELEGWIDAASAATRPLKQFILPGGTELACRLHIARAVSRRAERSIVALAAEQTVRAELLHYLNRVSDLLFAWARQVNQSCGAQEVPWSKTS